MPRPGYWSWVDNLLYLTVILGTVLLTIAVIWVVKRFGVKSSPSHSLSSHQTEIKLVFEETLSATDRALVRDQQVLESIRYLSRDPNLEAPLELWRDKRREWAAQQAFLETLGKNPAAETLADPQTSNYLRHLHSLVAEFESAQRALLRAVRQSISTGGNRNHLGITDSD